MNHDADIIDQQFCCRVTEGDLPIGNNYSLDAHTIALLKQLFASQLLSRHLDLQSRTLQAKGESFYTIGSSGHEGMAGVAAALQPDDMAFLHYRDAAFYIQRATQVSAQNPMRDLLLSFTASAHDPISGGRHKVLGNKLLSIPPQTSTIASHLPKAVGAAASIGINKSLNRKGIIPEDGLVICSFGDASLNHSTAQGALNTASWMAHQNMHLPLLFVCEDNGIGISVKTPSGWVETRMRNHPSMHYISCNGLDVLETYQATQEAATYIRTHRKPVFLHISCVRLMGHAGSDVQSSYLSDDDIAAMHSHDPLLYTAQLLLKHDIYNADEIISLYKQTAKDVAAEAINASAKPKLETADEVMASLIPPKRSHAFSENVTQCSSSQAAKPLPMVRHINHALHDALNTHPDIIMAGEDIGRKGGVYGVTKKLQQRYGTRRVIDTLLDEQSILGLAIGMAHNGLLPIVEIQFLAYLHNAEDQIRGEAATLSFFSSGQYTNPMIVRIAGLAYQKGFGGHFHNDNSFAVLRDIPGVIIACPSNGADAVHMLRECIRLCHEEQRVIIFLEPIALYGIRDLHTAGDDEWCHNYNNILNQPSINFQEIGVYGDGTDLCIITYGNGYYLSRQAAKILEEEHNIYVRMIDIRWLHPLPEAAILEIVAPCAHTLIVDECRKTGSLSEALLTLLAEHEYTANRLCAHDSFIPLGKAATITLPSKDMIIENALKIVKDQ